MIRYNCESVAKNKRIRAAESSYQEIETITMTYVNKQLHDVLDTYIIHYIFINVKQYIFT